MADADAVTFCPRCRGRLWRASDKHGSWSECLACGNVIEDMPPLTIDADPSAHPGRRRGTPGGDRTRAGVL